MVFDSGMEEKNRKQHLKLASLCIVLSICVHIGTVLLLLSLPERAGMSNKKCMEGEEEHQQTQRNIRIHRASPKQEKARPFAKTSADEEQHKPIKADFEGKHNTQASGDDSAPERRSDAPLPTMQGEMKEEIVTFDQERQEGDLEHEGKRDTRPTPPQAIEIQSPLPDAPTIPPGQGVPDNAANHHTNLGDGQNNTTPEAIHSAKIPTPTPEGDTLLQTRQEEARPQALPSPPSARKGLPDVNVPAPLRPSIPSPRRVSVYDPSLADHVQQAGFRTRERRSRSTGRFVMGRKPSLNVAATPRGRYEAEIYRRIARIWYAACDEHRGDIIPGTIVISLRIDKRGYLRNMQLMSRRGAGAIQQSFTLGAIRRATLPPMPSNVAADVVGDLMELLIEFNFD